jgi:hypothetical protein
MRPTLSVALFFGVAAIGCRSRQPPSTESQPSAKPPSAMAAIPSSTATTEQRQVRLVGCRVLAVNGANAKTSGAAYQGRFFDGNAWVELAPEVSLSLKHSETTREFAVHGPGRFLVCPSGEESVLVASGVFSSTAGPGSRAGAEVLVGTPLGTVRYGDANLRIDVRPKGVEVNVRQGSARFDRAAESKQAAEATQTLEAPKGRVSIAASTDAVRLVEHCNELRSSVARGRKPTAAAAGSAGPLLGSWAATQLKMRQEARIACASAHAASGRLDEPERSRLLSLAASGEAAGRADTSAAPDAGK